MSYLEDQKLAFEASQRDVVDSMCCLLAAFRELGCPKSLLDVGCGPGHMVRAAHALGVAATGIDLYVQPQHYPMPSLIRHDLREFPWPVDGKFEFVVCLEVAEHIPTTMADRFCEELARLTGSGRGSSVLLFSAAFPGQGGHGHINEQPTSWWLDKLKRAGLHLLVTETRELKATWSRVAIGSWWYGSNLLIMERHRYE